MKGRERWWLLPFPISPMQLPPKELLKLLALKRRHIEERIAALEAVVVPEPATYSQQLDARRLKIAQLELADVKARIKAVEDSNGTAR